MTSIKSASKVLLVLAALGLTVVGCDRPGDQSSGGGATSGSSGSAGSSGSSGGMGSSGSAGGTSGSSGAGGTGGTSGSGSR